MLSDSPWLDPFGIIRPTLSCLQKYLRTLLVVHQLAELLYLLVSSNGRLGEFLEYYLCCALSELLHIITWLEPT